MEQILQVVPTDGFTLNIYLDSGRQLDLDLSGKLHTIRFSILSDQNLFLKAKTDGNYIRWGEKVELSIREIIEMTQGQ